ncbi:MAG TPA: dihydrofolate reductase family protein [Trebonia sp.]|nr:dihydrofolate reductase family protein [Trebonia sp.]
MARLIYSAIMSLDGYIADADGNFDWAAPDEEVHAFVNDLERSVGTYLYGRRMYETMRYWETAHAVAGQRPVSLDVGGAHLAAQAIAAGLVDEYQLFAVPAIVGGGTRALPDLVRLDLALAEERRFTNGTVYLCYRQA